MTSAQAVAFVRKRFGRKTKVGHLGTLDPAATGVLPLAVASATRLIPYLPEAHKAYRAEILLGYTSDTLDTWGQMRPQGDSCSVRDSAVKAALSEFSGTIEQVPPRVSAIRVGGKRSYDRAREGEDFELAPRPATYHRVRLVARRGPRLTIDVECGPGTYIRSLARDLGQKVGCAAVLAFLIRVRSGPFWLSQAVTLEEVLKAHREECMEAMLTSCQKAFSHLDSMSLAGVDFQKGREVQAPAKGSAGQLVLVNDFLAQWTERGTLKLLARAPAQVAL